MNMWGESGTPIHIADGQGSFCILMMLDGLFQGHNLSSILFCLGLRRALRRFLAAYSQSECDQSRVPVHFEYIDDMLMKLAAAEVGTWLPLLQNALATVRLKLNLTKCKVWIPSWPDSTLHPELRAASLTQVLDGLDVMGGALDGQHAARITADALALPAASQKRLLQAKALAQTITQMLRTPLSRPARRTAWTMLDKVLNKSLDYDARILHPESFSNLA